jgi:hypothetical protein
MSTKKFIYTIVPHIVIFLIALALTLNIKSCTTYDCEELASKCASTQCNEEELNVRAACIISSKKGD